MVGEGAGDLGGTMRLGTYPAKLLEGSVVRAAYDDAARIDERHRHRYEVNNAYRDQLEGAGLVFSGLSPDNTLVEFVELPREVHPYRSEGRRVGKEGVMKGRSRWSPGH